MSSTGSMGRCKGGQYRSQKQRSWIKLCQEFEKRAYRPDRSSWKIPVSLRNALRSRKSARLRKCERFCSSIANTGGGASDRRWSIKSWYAATLFSNAGRDTFRLLLIRAESEL